MARIDNLLGVMITQKASDLHLSTGSPPVFRVNGYLEVMQYPPLDEQTIRDTILAIAPEDAKQAILNGRTAAFAYEMERTKAGRFRFNVYHEHRGLSAAIRFVRNDPPRLEDLGLPPIVPNFTQGFQGLVLIVGTTGAGKSTTLAACINEINATEQMHIITLEQPIEYIYGPGQCLIHQREVGLHTPSYVDGITNALQQDPDILVLGEMRETEAIRLGMTAAETGHLVLSTLHASTPAKAIERLISAFPPDEQGTMRVVLAENLRCIIGQKLLLSQDRTRRHVAAEILVNTPAIASMIRDGDTHQIANAILTGRKYGMQSMNDALAALIRAGKVDLDDALSQTVDVAELRKMIQMYDGWEDAPGERGW